MKKNPKEQHFMEVVEMRLKMTPKTVNLFKKLKIVYHKNKLPTQIRKKVQNQKLITVNNQLMTDNQTRTMPIKNKALKSNQATVKALPLPHPPQTSPAQE